MEEERVCRTCFEVFPKCNLTSINEVHDDEKTIKEKLFEYIPELTIDIVEEPLVCQYCISTIRLAYQFKSICIQGEKVLYKFIKNKSGFLNTLLTTEDLLSIVNGNFEREHCYSSSQMSLADGDSSDSENVSEQEDNEKLTSPQHIQTFLETMIKRVKVGETSTDAISNPIHQNSVKSETMRVENNLSLNPTKTNKNTTSSPSRRKPNSNTKDTTLFESNKNTGLQDSLIDSVKTNQVSKKRKKKDISKSTKESNNTEEEQNTKQINRNKRNGHNTSLSKRRSTKKEKLSVSFELNNTELLDKQKSPNDCLEVVLQTDINKENSSYNFKSPTGKSRVKELYNAIKITEEGKITIENPTQNESKSTSSISIQDDNVKDSTFKRTTSQTFKKRMPKIHLKRKTKMRKLKSLPIKNNTSIPKTESSNSTSNHLSLDTFAGNESDTSEQNMNETFASSQSNIDEAQIDGDCLTCNTCSKSFTYKSQYDVHLKSHVFQKLFSCPVCEKDFSQEKYLRQHALTHTTRAGPYQCEICNKSLSATTALKRHQRTHTGEKPYLCPTCEKPFAQKVQLDVHMRIHTGLKPFTCGTCGLRFAQKSHLLGHVRIHTGEKPFKCDICPKSFRKLPGLQIHQESHKKKPFQCYVCNFLFKDPQVFTRHVNKHVASLAKAGSPVINNGTEDGDTKPSLDMKLLEQLVKYSPYYCAICDKHFFNALSLKRHNLKLHSTN